MNEPRSTFPPAHYIGTVDGGWDGLLPGRWIAEVRFVSPVLFEYGPDEATAVAAMRARLLKEYPLAPWFSQVPVLSRRPVGA